jgi:hypothetical protein
MHSSFLTGCAAYTGTAEFFTPSIGNKVPFGVIAVDCDTRQSPLLPALVGGSLPGVPTSDSPDYQSNC